MNQWLTFFNTNTLYMGNIITENRVFIYPTSSYDETQKRIEVTYDINAFKELLIQVPDGYVPLRSNKVMTGPEKVRQMVVVKNHKLTDFRDYQDKHPREFFEKKGYHREEIVGATGLEPLLIQLDHPHKWMNLNEALQILKKRNEEFLVDSNPLYQKMDPQTKRVALEQLRSEIEWVFLLEQSLQLKPTMASEEEHHHALEKNLRKIPKVLI